MAGYPWFLMGIGMSCTASLFGTLGKVLMKLSHSVEYGWLVFAVAIVCVVVLNPLFDSMSYAYAAQSILAPMAGLSVVWNMVLSPYILKETLAEADIRGTTWIVVGCILDSISGNHDTPNHSPEMIFTLFMENVFIAYSVTVLLVAILLVWVIRTYPRTSNWRRFAFGMLAGLVGGNLYFLKAAVELIGQGGEVWNHKETYLIIVGALGTPAGGIFILNRGLREYDALYLVAVYETFLIVIGSISGVIFYKETAGMTYLWQQVLYPLSILITVYGIYILSTNLARSSDVVKGNGMAGELEGLVESGYHGPNYGIGKLGPENELQQLSRPSMSLQESP